MNKRDLQFSIGLALVEFMLIVALDDYWHGKADTLTHVLLKALVITLISQAFLVSFVLSRRRRR